MLCQGRFTRSFLGSRHLTSHAAQLPEVRKGYAFPLSVTSFQRGCAWLQCGQGCPRSILYALQCQSTGRCGCTHEIPITFPDCAGDGLGCDLSAANSQQTAYY